jgi:hypothetical protein
MPQGDSTASLETGQTQLVQCLVPAVGVKETATVLVLVPHSGSAALTLGIAHPARFGRPPLIYFFLEGLEARFLFWAHSALPVRDLK